MTIEKLSDNEFLFTSESVTEGHPDKMADQISDSVLDAIMAEDSSGRVACETFVTTGLIVIKAFAPEPGLMSAARSALTAAQCRPQ